MSKQKYYYNPSTLSYEKAGSSRSTRILKALAYLGVVLFFASLIAVGSHYLTESPKERMLKREISAMQTELLELNSRLEQTDLILEDIAERDNNVYRVLFEAEPISKEIRDAGIGGSQRYSYMNNYNLGELMREGKVKMDILEKKLAIQSKSFDEIKELVENKEEMLASIPAIRPVSQKADVSLVSGFGRRYHPIYKTKRLHAGLDFSAAVGTEVYATGNGRIEKTERKRSGYGSHIVINHGFGFKTLYAHLSEIDVRVGQQIKRGELIGKTGNTGTSTAPHLHYEVIRGGSKINPIHYFFNDLTPEEYEEIIEKAELSNQSFD